MGYPRSKEQIVIPYPFLSEGAEVTVGNIPNTYLPIPADGAALNRWYQSPNSRNVTIPAGNTLVIVRPYTSAQVVYWDTAPDDAVQVRTVQANDYVMVYNGKLVPIRISGFNVFTLGDLSGSAVNSTAFVRFEYRVAFAFTPATE